MKTWIWVASFVWLMGCGSKAGPIVGYARGIAVINSDYHSSALTLLNPNGDTVVDPCLHSGSTSPRLSLALSGDVVLPSQDGGTGEVVLIDRTNDAVAWVDPNTCGVARQLGVTQGLQSNPHDFVSLRPDKGYVTLFSGDGAAGNGVVIVNPQGPSLVGNIILSTLATKDSNNVSTLARPDRAILAKGFVFVTLGNVDATFKQYGPGRVVIIDPNTDQVAAHVDITAGRGCSGMATEGNILVVGCDGDMHDPDHVTNSAIFTYDISMPLAPLLTGTITAEQLQRSKVNSGGLVVADGHVYFGAVGSVDAVYRDTTVLFSVDGAKTLGGIALAAGDIYAADADTRHPAVVHAQGSGTPKRITTAPFSLLPPRTLLSY